MSRDDSETKGGGSRLVSWVKAVPLVAATDPRIEALIFSYRTDVILPRSMRKESLQPALAFFSLSDLQKALLLRLCFQSSGYIFQRLKYFQYCSHDVIFEEGWHDRPSVHVWRGRHPGNIEERRCQVDVEDWLSPDGARLDPRPADKERDLGVHFEGEGLPLDQAELAEMVAVVGRVKDVSVVQLSYSRQLVTQLKGIEEVRFK